jgi:hypothetical protein
MSGQSITPGGGEGETEKEGNRAVSWLRVFFNFLMFYFLSTTKNTFLSVFVFG